MSSGGKARPANLFVGSAIERREDLRFLRGRGTFVDDLMHSGLLHAAILRSSIAHGRIRSIDATAAQARPGVHAVITAADIGESVPKIPLRQEAMPAFVRFEQPVIAQAKVRYVGEPLAVVVAETAAMAEDALEVIPFQEIPFEMSGEIPAIQPKFGDRDYSRPGCEQEPYSLLRELRGRHIGCKPVSAQFFRELEPQEEH